MVKKIKLQSIF